MVCDICNTDFHLIVLDDGVNKVCSSCAMGELEAAEVSCDDCEGTGKDEADRTCSTCNGYNAKSKSLLYIKRIERISHCVIGAIKNVKRH